MMEHVAAQAPAATHRSAPQGDWARRYPILLPCLASGRRPSDAEVAKVARRVRRELGPAPQDAGRDQADPGALAVARVALEGQRPSDAARSSSLALRGH
jgi:hypothetical protein